MRYRSCGAVFLGDKILMVRHVHDGRDYWTLLGGGIDEGEMPWKAAELEVLGENGVRVQLTRLLFTAIGERGSNSTHCFLMTALEQDEIKLGFDPEEAHLSPANRMLLEVNGLSVESVREEIMVSRVLELLISKDGL